MPSKHESPILYSHLMLYVLILCPIMKLFEKINAVTRVAQDEKAIVYVQNTQGPKRLNKAFPNAVHAGLL